MNRVAAAFTLAMMVAQCGRAAPPQSISVPAQSMPAQGMSLTLPHPLRHGETAFIQVQVGVIGPGQQIEVSSADGRTIGTISPHGIRAGHAAGTYTLPLPRDAIEGDHIMITLMVTRSDSKPRAPGRDEVRSVQVIVNAAPLPSP